MNLRNIALAAALVAGTAVGVPQSRQAIYDGLNDVGSWIAEGLSGPGQTTYVPGTCVGVRAYGKQVFEKVEAGKPLTPYETSAFDQITSGSLDGCSEK